MPLITSLKAATWRAWARWQPEPSAWSRGGRHFLSNVDVLSTDVSDLSRPDVSVGLRVLPVGLRPHVGDVAAHHRELGLDLVQRLPPEAQVEGDGGDPPLATGAPGCAAVCAGAAGGKGERKRSAQWYKARGRVPALLTAIGSLSSRVLFPRAMKQTKAMAVSKGKNNEVGEKWGALF